MVEGRIRVRGLWKIVHTDYEVSESVPGVDSATALHLPPLRGSKKCSSPREPGPGVSVDPVKKCSSRSDDGVTFERISAKNDCLDSRESTAGRVICAHLATAMVGKRTTQIREVFIPD